MVRPTSDGRVIGTAGTDIPSKVAGAGIAVGFGLLLLLSYTKNVNWDEFYFLSHVHAYLDGRLDRPLQTFFVHGFTWLDRLPAHEMAQVFAARVVMVALVGVTVLSIYRIAGHLTDSSSAKIAVLAFITSGFVLPHGASFRADPIAAALLTSSVALMMTAQMKLMQVVLVAVLSALSLLVTIKAALYAPAFLAALLWRRNEKGVVLRILLSGALAAGLFATLYLWHASGIQPAPGNETATNVREAAATGLLQSGLFPRAPYILMWAVLSIVPIIMAVVGLIAQKSVNHAVLLTLLAAPLLSVVIYRNAFPYFFPFATPLMMIAVAFGAKALQQSQWLPRCVVIMLMTGALQAALSFKEGQAAQYATIVEVHRLFPEPVPYIDDSNMLATFPSVGPFMSSWGMKNYREAGRPVFGGLIADHQPPLLVANKWTLMTVMERAGSGLLLPEDDRALRETYVHYNGAIWLAGRAVTLTQPQQRIGISIAGRYRVETSARIQINGRVVDDGDIISLGDQAVLTGSVGTQVRLVWATGAAPLQTDLPDQGIYADFWALQL